MGLQNYSVLVTGADGFIGSWLCKGLVEKKARVTATVLNSNKINPLLKTVKREIELVQMDVTKKEEIEKEAFNAKIDCCVHLAAITDTACNEEECLQNVNVCGTENVLKACKENNVRNFIFSSTMGVYGESKNSINEESILMPSTAYAESKTKAEEAVKEFCKDNGINALILRQTNVFGAYDFNTKRIVPNTILRFARGKAPEIRSHPCVRRDLLYVKDAVRAYIKGIEYLVQNKGVEIINVVNRKSFTVKEIIETIAELMGENFKLKENCNKVEAKYSNDKVTQLLGWQTEYGFKKALEETIAHYISNQELYQSQIKS